MPGASPRRYICRGYCRVPWSCERSLHIPLNPAASLGRPSEFTIGQGIWCHRGTDRPYLFAFQGWTITRTSQPTPALTDGADEQWRTIAGVHLTTRRRLVTVIELGREPADVLRPLVLAAEIHAGWPGARSWLGAGAEVLPRLEYVPYLRDALDRTLAEAVERVEQWIREAGWERDSPDTERRC